MPARDCPSEADLKAFVVGELPDLDSQRVSDHLEDCSRCESLTQQLERLDDPFIQAIRQGEPPTLDQIRSAGGSPAPTAEEQASRLLDEPGVPVQVADYTILEELGRGGMGVVFKARQARLGRLVALKMILHGLHAGAAELVRFHVEAQTIARLQHPNIVQVYEVGEDEGKPFLSLEYCAGGNLRQRLQGTPLPIQEAVQLVQVLARAMQAAHDKHVIHRDLKPANVLFAEDGTPKISDFGLAKKLDDKGLTGSGAILGTPSYMAPEQARGQSQELGPACDIYALGAILYECMTGRPPFLGSTPMETIMAVMHNEVVAPSRLHPKVPRDAETICLKCLQPTPAKRYASAAALAEDLQRWQQGEAILARPIGRLEWTVKWARKRPAAAILAGLVVLLIGATIAGGFWYQQLRFDQFQEHERRQLRQVSVENDIRAALEEIDQRRQGLHRKLADPIATSELNSDLDGWQAALNQNQTAWKRADWMAADNAALLTPGLASRIQDVGEQLAADQAGWHLARELEDIRLENFRMIQHQADWSRKRLRYAQVFARLGLDFAKDKPEQLAAKMRAHPLCFVLVAALDYWASVTPDTKELLPCLLQTSRRADPHPWRNRVRDPSHWFRKENLDRLVKEIVLAEHSPHFLGMVAIQQRKNHSDATVLLRGALRIYPRDFWLNYLRGLGLKDRTARIECFRACLLLRPQSSFAHNNLGVTLLDHGDLEGAIFHFHKAIDQDANFAGAHLNLGNVLHQKKNQKGAIWQYQKALALDPEYAGAHVNLGVVLSEQGNLKAAIAHCRQAVSLAPNDGQARAHLAAYLRESGQFKEAIVHGQKALALDFNNAATQNNLALALSDAQDWQGAIFHFQQAIKQNPKLAEAYSNLGAILRRQKDLKGALAYHQQAVQLNPKSAGMHYNLAKTWHDLRELERAITHYRQTLELEPNYTAANRGLVTAHVHFGLELAGKKNFAAATGQFQQALQREPRNALVHFYFGCVLADAKDLPRAADQFRKAIEYNPNLTTAYLHLGNVLRDTNDLPGAIVQYRKAIDRNANDAVLHYNLANVLRDTKDVKGARIHYQKALDLNPKYAAAHSNLGMLQAQQKDPDGALFHYQKALELNPKLLAPRINLGNLLLGKKDVAGALAQFQQALQFAPKSAVVHHHLGHAFALHQDPERAILHLKKAIALDPKYTLPRCKLGDVLLSQGRFAEAHQQIQEAHALCVKQKEGERLATKLLKQCEQLLRLDRQLTAVLANEAPGVSAAEYLQLADLCVQYKKKYVAAARFYETAFAQESALAEDLAQGHRLRAARAAVLAGSGKGQDAKALPEPERSVWRLKALGWLRADFRLHTAALQAKSLKGEALTRFLAAQEALTLWRSDAALAAVRDPKRLAKLPAAEQQSWNTLWHDVDEGLQKAGKRLTSWQANQG